MIWAFLAQNADVLSVVFGSISASAWLLAAIITPHKQSGFYGGPPKGIVRRLKIGAIFNALGAAAAAAMMFVQVAERLQVAV